MNKEVSGMVLVHWEELNMERLSLFCSGQVQSAASLNLSNRSPGPYGIDSHSYFGDLDFDNLIISMFDPQNISMRGRLSPCL